MSLSFYLHYPFCLSKCPYCNFTSHPQNIITHHETEKAYVHALVKEIQLSKSFVPSTQIKSLYWGGGTPSLWTPESIVSIMEAFEKTGFSFLSEKEITIEINPETVDQPKLDFFLSCGINRFSVGAQTFNPFLLKSIGRRHTVKQTHSLLSLLSEKNLNYSFDLMYGLPNQTLNDLKTDLSWINHYRPPHISAYLLDISNNNPLYSHLPSDEILTQMIHFVRGFLLKNNYQHYEISNFCRPEFASRHNLTYWNLDPFWGLGVSSHSYLPNKKWGLRFWHPSTLNDYLTKIKHSPLSSTELSDLFDSDHLETLNLPQALTDYCHVSFRKDSGLSEVDLFKRFPSLQTMEVMARLHTLKSDGLLYKKNNHWKWSNKGLALHNLILEALTF